MTAKNAEGLHGEGSSPAIALGDAVGEAADASPRVGAPGLAGGRSDSVERSVRGVGIQAACEERFSNHASSASA